MPDIQQILARLHDPYAAAQQWAPVLSNIVSGVNDPAASGDPTYGQRVTTPGAVGYNEAASWLVNNPGSTTLDYFQRGPGANTLAQNNAPGMQYMNPQGEAFRPGVDQQSRWFNQADNTWYGGDTSGRITNLGANPWAPANGGSSSPWSGLAGNSRTPSPTPATPGLSAIVRRRP